MPVVLPIGLKIEMPDILRLGFFLRETNSLAGEEASSFFENKISTSSSLVSTSLSLLSCCASSIAFSASSSLNNFSSNAASIQTLTSCAYLYIKKFDVK